MSRDYTKYNVEGLGENLNKRQLVFTIVKDYVEKNNPSFEDLQKVFPDEVQGSKGFIRKESDVKTPKRFNMREPLKIKNGAHVVVSNQWGGNIERFFECANQLGYTIASGRVEDNTSSVAEISLFTTHEELIAIVDNVVQGSEDEKNKFVSNVLSFINTNREYYWMIPSVKNRLKDWEVKIDDEGLELSIHSLQINGRDLSYNPYQEYRLFYNWREGKFSFEESDMDPRGFFQTLMDAYFDLDAYEDAADLSEEELAILLNLSKTVLYCTVSKECENNIDQDDLINLLLAINFEEMPALNEAIMGGDISVEVLEDVLVSFQLDLEDYKDEEFLWRDMYLMNYEKVAEYLLENDVFDNDYIPS